MSLFSINDVDNVFITHVSIKDRLTLMKTNNYYNCLFNDDIYKEYKKLLYNNYNLKDDIFKLICEIGLLKLAKHWISFYDIDINKIANTYINDCCKNNHLELAQWLYSLFENIKINNINNTIEQCCKFGFIDTVMWLFSLKDQNIIINNDMFTAACSNGYLELAKWLYSSGKINIPDYIFGSVCSHGHLDIAKWLYSIVNDINIHYIENYTFDRVCGNGHLDVAKFLLSIYNINIHVNNDSVFKNCIHENQLEVIKWLYSLDPTYERNYYYYSELAYFFEHHEMSNWFKSLIES